MTKELILIVEDEASIRDMLSYVLMGAGFEVLEAENANFAEKLIHDRIPHLILLDWMLPQTSGIEYAHRLKTNTMTRDIPIILLTAKADEEHKLQGLSAGADDYITKPFSPRELIARIKTVLRRGPLVSVDGLISANGLVLDVHQHKVTLHHQVLTLSTMEYRLLHYFMNHQNRVATRDTLLQHVWGGHVDINERTVDVQVKRLRKILSTESCDDFIQTIRGVGYLFKNKDA